MPEPLDTTLLSRTPTADRPLLGQTVLVVEDSRYACEAIRLMCLHSGARIRRADCLRAAARHLATYRPSVLIVDMGLPDGSGENLIREIAATDAGVDVILGMSGDPAAEARARCAGADAFLRKPVESLALFQETILGLLPAAAIPVGPRPVAEASMAPDALALHDDLQHARTLLSSPPDQRDLGYLAQFLGALARSAHDRPLEDAARTLGDAHASGTESLGDVARLIALVNRRIGRGAVV